MRQRRERRLDVKGLASNVVLWFKKLLLISASRGIVLKPPPTLPLMPESKQNQSTQFHFAGYGPFNTGVWQT